MAARRGNWRAIGDSVIGVTHARDGRACQDAFRVHLSTPGAVVVAVADGHGQAKSFRSQDGASIAVGVAVDTLVNFAQSEPGESNGAFRARKDLAGHLPRVVAQTWRERVQEHSERHPFSPDELVLLGDRFSIVPDQPMSPDAYRSLWRAYGSTLVAVLVTGSYALGLQLGDGLLMAAGASGEGFEVLDPDALNFGTSTTSLSDEDAEVRLRWRIIPHEGDYPILYWLCTDGYEKAFRSNDLAGVCVEYREAFREPDGWRIIQENLAEGLHQASARGTGDDATAAFLFFDECETGTEGGGVAAVSVPDGEAILHDVAGVGQDVGISDSDSGLTGSDSLAEVSGPVSPECGNVVPVASHDRPVADSSEASESNRDLGAEGGPS